MRSLLRSISKMPSYFAVNASIKLLSVPRVILLLLVTAVAMLATGDPRLGSPAHGQTRPNIIFVLTDDQFPGTENAMPALKNNVTGEGIKFNNTTSTFPLCCPGRATILRGQYAHNTHIYTNSLPLGGWEKFRNQGFENSNIATWLHGAGYRTGLFGKYLNNYTGRNVPLGWDRWYAWNGHNEGWTSLNDQGTQKPLSPKDADPGVSNAALKFLDNRLDGDRPVFAFVNFGAEHTPYHHADIDADKFKGVGVPRTSSFNEDDVRDKPSNVSDLPRLSNAEVSQLDQDYRNGLRSLMRVDRFIGNASDLLRRKDEMGNTYFVFYTDNGSHFGQHRFPHGKLQPYKEDTNFPLIMRGPGVPHGVSTGKPLGNHDIAPTLARIGGANVPSFVDGRSFLRLAKNPTTATWSRTAVLSEKETNDVPPNVWNMLRMPGKSYTLYQGQEKEYYDLIRDSHQVHNAFGKADTTYSPPSATQDYYDQRLGDLYACSGHDEGPGSCRVAEDAPLTRMNAAP
jgi:N-acetylglucosamine-6-sulfatase